MAEPVSDEDNPMLLKKPKQPEPNPLYPDMSKYPPAELTKEKGAFQKLVDWYNGPGIKPYVSIKNLNDAEAKPVPAAVVGIKINF